MKVEEIMSHDFAAVLPTTSLKRALHVMATHRLPGLPVINRGNEVVGFLSEKDIANITINPIYKKTDMLTLKDFAKITAVFSQGKELRVEDVMVKRPVIISEQADCSEATKVMVNQGLKAIPVTRSRKLVGILRRADLCFHLMGQSDNNRITKAISA